MYSPSNLFLLLHELHRAYTPPFTDSIIVHIFYINTTTPPPIHDCDAEGGALVATWGATTQPEAGDIYRFSFLKHKKQDVSLLLFCLNLYSL